MYHKNITVFLNFIYDCVSMKRSVDVFDLKLTVKRAINH